MLSCKTRSIHLGALCLALAAAPCSAAIAGPGGWLALKPGQTSHLVIEVQGDDGQISISDISGPPGRPIPLTIQFDDSGVPPTGKLFIFSGVPEGVKLEPGGNFGQFWAVNSQVFDKLTLTAPEGIQGSFRIKVTQTGSSPDSKFSSTFTTTIQPEEIEATETVAAVQQPVQPTRQIIQTPQQPARTEPNLRDNALMERATTLFSIGDISGARTVFEYLAARGNAQAAIALGGTYDPTILGQLFVKGLDADPEQARKWYRKAEELGSPEASSRLSALRTQ
ncbi:MAG: hypothetical protein ACFCUR_02390 [Rhodomicrobiaceae bacterium]